MHYLREYVHGMEAELVFNLDEAGMSDWDDRKDKKVIVTKTMDGQTIHDTRSRITKRETHIDNHVYHYCWRVLDALHCDITGL
jgi:hypothetical protein